MAAAAPSPHPAVLMDVLVEQFLLRLPPQDPADLARAALVSKQWHRVVTGAIFRRRHREFHRSPPLLGYMINLAGSPRFVHMSSFRPPRVHRGDVEAVHSSHGRILLRSTRDDWELDDLYLFVWHPVMNKEWQLPVLLSSPGPYISNWDAAVVCAVGDGCSHIDCHFKVVVVGKSGGRTFSCFYSSEAGSWSDRIFVSEDGFCLSNMGSVLIGNTLYFRRGRSLLGEMVIIKYDLLTHQMCTISLQCGFERGLNELLIATEDGRLGVAQISNSTLSLWLKEQGRLVVGRVSQLHTLLPPEALGKEPWVAAFADTGAGIIFVRTCVGYFTIDLNSGRCKKVGECLGSRHIVPYVSFCSRAPGMVSTDDVGQGASVVVSTYDEPATGVALSRDEGPGDGAVVSTDEGPGPIIKCIKS